MAESERIFNKPINFFNLIAYEKQSTGVTNMRWILFYVKMDMVLFHTQKTQNDIPTRLDIS